MSNSYFIAQSRESVDDEVSTNSASQVVGNG